MCVVIRNDHTHSLSKLCDNKLVLLLQGFLFPMASAYFIKLANQNQYIDTAAKLF